MVNEEYVIEKTEEYVKKVLEDKCISHDWWHVYRVWKNAVVIGEQEGVDLFVVQLAALLHDIADWKFNGGDILIGPRLVREWLEKMDVRESVISHVCEIVIDMPFKGAGVKSEMETKEGEVAQDADRLDAIGAVGIFRAFAYGGYRRREIYNPDIKPERHNSFAQYRNSTGTIINHFYEKLLLLKDLMNTGTARKMAEERHAFMELYLDRFFREWEGEQ
jgi:uncharacterized protein